MSDSDHPAASWYLLPPPAEREEADTKELRNDTCLLGSKAARMEQLLRLRCAQAKLTEVYRVPATDQAPSLGERVGPAGKLEFPLPECASEFQLAAGAGELWSVIWELDQRLRNLLKHDGLSGQTAQGLADEIRADLAGVITKYTE